jgi:hypothetical protein
MQACFIAKDETPCIPNLERSKARRSGGAAEAQWRDTASGPLAHIRDFPVTVTH